MRLLQILCVAALLSACGTFAPDPVPPTPYERVCAVLDCSGLDEPILVISYVVSDHKANMLGGLRGLHYPGERYVFVKAGMTRAAKLETSVHEILHYVGWHSYDINNRCESEEFAREWTSIILDTPFDYTWKERYRCV